MKIGIIIGSVREGRIGADIARWVREQAADRSVEYELIDLKAFDLPVYSAEIVPAHANGEYGDDRVNAWSRTIDGCDGYIFVTPEYNHSVPGALKNAFDCIFPEWWSKAVAFVSYGAAYGFRVVEHWRTIVANTNMYDIKPQVAFSTILHWQDGVFLPTERHAVETAALFDGLEASSIAMATLRAAV